MLEQLRHRVLPARIDLLRLHVRRRAVEVVGLEVAEDVGAGAEDRVVADAGVAERLQHLRPDVRVRIDVLVDLVRLDVEDEGRALAHVVSLTTRTWRLRGPWTPSTRLSSMSEVADGPDTNVTGRRWSTSASASGNSCAIWRSPTMQMCRSGTSVRAR